MLKQHIAACLVGMVLATAPALAQTSPAPTSSPASKAPSGMSGQFITQQTPGQWRASKLVGVDAHGTDNAKIGDVREVLVNRDGATEAVVIGVGGFLGLGEKDVAVPFQALEWVTEPRTTATSTAAPGTAPEAAPETLAPPPVALGKAPGSSAQIDSALAAVSRGYPDRAVLRMTKADLQNAPTFRFASDTRAITTAPANRTNPRTRRGRNADCSDAGGLRLAELLTWSGLGQGWPTLSGS
jgi:hypothetical protein